MFWAPWLDPVKELFFLDDTHKVNHNFMQL